MRLKTNSIMLTGALFLAALMSGNSAYAQVRIGKDIEPEKGAILDLNAKTGSGYNGYVGGLLLPNVSITDITKIPEDFTDETVRGQSGITALTGLWVYSLTPCPGVYVWDGGKWEKLGEPCPSPSILCLADYFAPDASKTVTITVPNTDKTHGDTRDDIPLTFLTYNLGANPALSPKQQMAYQSPVLPAGGGTVDPVDVVVYGGLFQWGRSDIRHAFRCKPDPDASSDERFHNGPVANEAAANGKFVWNTYSNSSYNDWINDDNHIANSDLWGNGNSIESGGNSNPAAGSANPCPNGFRVPTQHEWALLGHEIGNSTEDYDEVDSGDDFYSSLPINTTSLPNNSGIVWVPVHNGLPNLTAWNGSIDPEDQTYGQYHSMNGYALYTVADWTKVNDYLEEGGGDDTNDYNGKHLYDGDDTSVPAPLLFLPAAGARSFEDGSVYFAGNWGRYWSSTIGSYSSDVFCFSSVDVGSDYNAGKERAIGYSVRCVSAN
jgi:hypothetical protein